MEPAWVREIQKQCGIARVPFFFKQWGGVNKKRAGRVLDGRTWDEMPAGLLPGLRDGPMALPAWQAAPATIPGRARHHAGSKRLRLAEA